MFASVTSAPNIVVRGKSRRMPPITSATPVKISYAVDAPIDTHRRPCNDRLPTGWSSVVSGGAGICVGITFAMPKEQPQPFVKRVFVGQVLLDLPFPGLADPYRSDHHGYDQYPERLDPEERR